MDRFSFEADLFVWFVAVSICFWRATLQSPNDAHAQFDVLASRSGREGSLPPNFFTLLCDISDLINGFHFPVFYDVMFLTKRNFPPLNFSTLNWNNRSISCTIMQNLGAFVGAFMFWCLFLAFWNQLTFRVVLAILNTFDEIAAAARSSTALTLIYGLGQSAEVAMLLFLFQKHPNSYFFSRQLHCNLIISQWISTENKQQIPFEKMATDCSKLARRPFWNHFESGYCFGLVSILRFKLFISRNGSRRCSSNHRLNELLQSSIKANSKGWWF